MQNTTNLCPEIIGANIRGLVELLAGDAVFQLINATNIIGNQSLRLAALHIGERCSFPINQLDHCNWKLIANL